MSYLSDTFEETSVPSRPGRSAQGLTTGEITDLELAIARATSRVSWLSAQVSSLTSAASQLSTDIATQQARLDAFDGHTHTGEDMDIDYTDSENQVISGTVNEVLNALDNEIAANEAQLQISLGALFEKAWLFNLDRIGLDLFGEDKEALLEINNFTTYSLAANYVIRNTHYVDPVFAQFNLAGGLFYIRATCNIKDVSQIQKFRGRIRVDKALDASTEYGVLNGVYYEALQDAAEGFGFQAIHWIYLTDAECEAGVQFMLNIGADFRGLWDTGDVTPTSPFDFHFDVIRFAQNI